MVAGRQPVLVSTGARDWIESNGHMERVEGGYRVTAVKHFASQSAAGDILVTSAPFEDPENGARVLHFTVPFGSEGLGIDENWRAMGMRGTGSHTVNLERVFVPDSAVTLDRPRGEFHPFWNVVLTVALPLIMSAYVGIARKAATIAIEAAAKQRNPKPYLASLVGALHNELTTAELNWKDMVRIANDLDFDPVDQNGHEILTRKTNVATACIGVVGKAMEIVGGQGFYRSFGLERLFRDVQAAHYHPLQEQDQRAFCGEFLLRSQAEKGAGK
jgi:alkylation response protein AidB-like acyl-CoA dehydrogenase